MCNQFPDCKPVDIQSNVTTTTLTGGGGFETATIYHIFAGSGVSGVYGAGGVDTLVQNMKLPKFFTFVQIWLTPEPLKLTPSGNWEPLSASTYSDEYQQKAHAEIEQNLDHIEGKTFLTKVTVKWGAIKNYGVSYSYAIILRGPEGWGVIPF